MSLVTMLRETVQREPKSLIAIDAGPADARLMTREEFWERVWTLSAELADKGVGRGDCVAQGLSGWSEPSARRNDPAQSSHSQIATIIYLRANLHHLHEGNIARYRLRLSEYRAWKNWRRPTTKNRPGFFAWP